VLEKGKQRAGGVVVVVVVVAPSHVDGSISAPFAG